MKTITMLCLFSFAAQAEPNYNQLANAIWKAEGGAKTRHPYGVMCRCRNARAVCIQTVRNAWTDWNIDHRPCDFLTYLSRIYCPPNWRVWSRNVRQLCAK